MSDSTFKMSLSLNVLNHLGLNLYSNIPAVLSEIVANSWDADASTVNIDITENEIIIEDNGCGMSVNDINNHFLKVGYQKRNDGNTKSPKYSRPYMGRKGIGKLSMFSIAREVDVISNKIADGNSNVIGLRMNIDKITEQIANEDKNIVGEYLPDELDVCDSEIPNGGTKIILRDLKKNTSTLTPEYIRKRVARRFGIIGEKYNFEVKVCGEPVSIEDRDYFHKLSYLWSYGDNTIYKNSAKNISYSDERPNVITYNGKNYTVYGWIGSVESSGDLKDGEDNLNKIVILVRGKLGQEDILSEYSEGGLYSKYIIGEINADFFDDDSIEDMATSSRQEYLKDDERYLALKSFIQNELKYIQAKWTDLRNESGENKALELLPAISNWVSTLKGDDKKYAKKMFGKINQITAEDEKRREILKYSVLAFEKLRYSNRLSEIDEIDSESFEAIKSVFIGIDDLEATLYYQIIKERISVIKKFQEITDDNTREKVIQEYLFNHLWLLDPSWERVDGTEYMEKTVLNALDKEAPLSPEEKAGRLDIGYKSVAGKHIIIELKRSDRVVSLGELNQQISKYNSALEKVLSEAGKGLPAIEIICVLGKPVDNKYDESHRDKVSKSIAAFNGRIVFYKELIENAFKSYSEYVEKNRETQPLINLIKELEDSDD